MDPVAVHLRPQQIVLVVNKVDVNSRLERSLRDRAKNMVDQLRQIRCCQISVDLEELRKHSFPFVEKFRHRVTRPLSHLPLRPRFTCVAIDAARRDVNSGSHEVCNHISHIPTRADRHRQLRIKV